MSRYRQLCAEERVQIATLRYQNFSLQRIARIVGRHRSTIWREVRRNRAPYDGGYRSARAHERAVARRRRSRRNQQFGHAEMGRLEALLRQQWSPEQVAGYLLDQATFSSFGLLLVVEFGVNQLKTSSKASTPALASTRFSRSRMIFFSVQRSVTSLLRAASSSRVTCSLRTWASVSWAVGSRERFR